MTYNCNYIIQRNVILRFKLDAHARQKCIACLFNALSDPSQATSGLWYGQILTSVPLSLSGYLNHGSSVQNQLLSRYLCVPDTVYMASFIIYNDGQFCFSNLKAAPLLRDLFHHLNESSACLLCAATTSAKLFKHTPAPTATAGSLRDCNGGVLYVFLGEIFNY